MSLQWFLHIKTRFQDMIIECKFKAFTEYFCNPSRALNSTYENDVAIDSGCFFSVLSNGMLACLALQNLDPTFLIFENQKKT